ncbi:uncharacterized protein L969DRAFT_18634 [Mixia osmundae IAM 14324]|uniref:Uncharacterized protein n=1 Tax=Mixia osmundae (strain CBS 9802 / IAM 14324 / JCM 22182 / KY 12970) TaxID=764103 RepID=G7EAB6_MIXOS|nr:uncharacterized protein L969DRAFT_18634 [Mixia osmundae IAM 14324]KEI37835.1 hypothetical protein L969DRAFT_18634 [Mixia osmundae IAM 14324]GAA99776.1 hypothetical protein E5Q_06479 [Mixia osmundae IAM 14324]
MFSLVVAGRLPQTNLQQVDATRFLFQVPEASSVNHLVVFLSTQPFPPGYGATVHFNLPGKDTWQLLGKLSNDKPSAIFRLKAITASTLTASQGLAFASATAVDTLNIGIQCEPLEQIEADLTAAEARPHASQEASAAMPTDEPSQSLALVTRTAPTEAVDPLLMAAGKLAKNLFTYLSSFSQSDAPHYFSLADVERWYRNVEQKLRNGGMAWLQAQD